MEGRSMRYFKYCRTRVPLLEAFELNGYRIHDDCMGAHALVYRNVAYGKPSKDRTVACDGCIKRRLLCTRLMERAGELKLGVFPLPENIRANVSWTDFAYWKIPGIEQ
jgi:hypothetical protein